MDKVYVIVCFYNSCDIFLIGPYTTKEEAKITIETNNRLGFCKIAEISLDENNNKIKDISNKENKFHTILIDDEIDINNFKLIGLFNTRQELIEYLKQAEHIPVEKFICSNNVITLKEYLERLKTSLFDYAYDEIRETVKEHREFNAEAVIEKIKKQNNV